MRKVIWGAAVSLDLYLAGPDEALDWLHWSDDAAAISAASWQGVDTLLMGRKTYDFAAEKRRRRRCRRLEDPHLHLLADHDRGARRAPSSSPSDPAAFVRRLKQEDGGDIIVMGGGELASALIEGGVVDEIGLNVHPLLLGGGIPFFRPMARRVALALVEARPIAKDCVFLRYRLA